MSARRKLTDEQIRRIRTEHKPHSLWARLFKVSVSTVRHARIGIVYKTCDTPPDTRRRYRAPMEQRA